MLRRSAPYSLIAAARGGVLLPLNEQSLPTTSRGAGRAIEALLSPCRPKQQADVPADPYDEPPF